MTYLLAMSEGEAQVWVQWGTHVFKDGEDGAQRRAGLEAYLNQKLDEAMTDPQDETFFGALVRAKIDGRILTREEQLGFANLTFAGGRDTVIHSISSTLHYLASQPESLAFLKEDVSRITHATEELFRAITPLTHIGRDCPVETEVHGQRVPAGGLCPKDYLLGYSGSNALFGRGRTLPARSWFPYLAHALASIDL